MSYAALAFLTLLLRARAFGFLAAVLFLATFLLTLLLGLEAALVVLRFLAVDLRAFFFGAAALATFRLLTVRFLAALGFAVLAFTLRPFDAAFFLRTTI